MKRYGRSGWFKDSYRHYLAAKGVTTTRRTDKFVNNEYFAKKTNLDNQITLRAMELQKEAAERGLSIRMIDAKRMAKEEFADVPRQSGLIAPAPQSREDLQKIAKANAVRKLAQGFDLNSAEEDLLDTQMDLSRVREKIRQGQTLQELRGELGDLEQLGLDEDDLEELQEKIDQSIRERKSLLEERSDLLGDEAGIKGEIGEAIGKNDRERRLQVDFGTRGRVMKMMAQRGNTLNRIAQGEIQEGEQRLREVNAAAEELGQKIDNLEASEQEVKAFNALQQHSEELEKSLSSAKTMGGSKIAARIQNEKKLADITANEPTPERKPANMTNLFDVRETEKFSEADSIPGVQEQDAEPQPFAKASQETSFAPAPLRSGVISTGSGKLSDSGFKPEGSVEQGPAKNREQRRLRKKAREGTDFLSVGESLFKGDK